MIFAPGSGSLSGRLRDLWGNGRLRARAGAPRTVRFASRLSALTLSVATQTFACGRSEFRRHEFRVVSVELPACSRLTTLTWQHTIGALRRSWPPPSRRISAPTRRAPGFVVSRPTAWQHAHVNRVALLRLRSVLVRSRFPPHPTRNLIGLRSARTGPVLIQSGGDGILSFASEVRCAGWSCFTNGTG